jgi:hypothetical protein
MASVRRHVVFLIRTNKQLCLEFDFGSTAAFRPLPVQSYWPLAYLQGKIEAQMFSTASPPLNDVLKLDFDDEYAPTNGGGPLKPGKSYRSAGVTNAQFKNHRPIIGRRLTRSLVGFFLPVFIGVGGVLVWQFYGGEMVKAWAPSLSWLFPAPLSAELQTQLKPVALNLAIMKRSIEQLANNQDQLSRKQDQMAQAIATLQAAVGDINQNILALAPLAPKAGHVSSKPAQPPAQ